MHPAEEKPKRNNQLLQEHLQNTAQGRKSIRQTKRLAAHSNTIRPMRSYLQIGHLSRCDDHLLVMSPDPRKSDD